MGGTSETVEAAIERMTAAAPTNDAQVARISPTEIVVTKDEASALVTFDTDKPEIRIDGLEILHRRLLQRGDQIIGGGESAGDDLAQVPYTIIAGKGVEISGVVVKEPVTGKWEPQPVDDVGRFIYDQLVLQGWHQKITRQSAATLYIAGAVFILLRLYSR